MKCAMTQSKTSLQDVVSTICRQFTQTFGAACCHLALSHRRFESQNDGVDTSNLTITLLPTDSSWQPSQDTSVNGEHEPPRETSPSLDSLDAMLQSDRPVVRFSLIRGSVNSAQLLGWLILIFPRPVQFSATEKRALLMTIELAAAMLARSELRQPETSTENDQWNAAAHKQVFELPFLEAKRQWIQAFEKEYLGQQMARHFGNISRVARSSRISRYTVYALMNKFNFSSKPFKRSMQKSLPPVAGTPALHEPALQTVPAEVEPVNGY